MELSMVSRSRERMDVLRFDGWQCKIRRQRERSEERQSRKDQDARGFRPFNGGKPLL